MSSALVGGFFCGVVFFTTEPCRKAGRYILTHWTTREIQLMSVFNEYTITCLTVC